MSWWKYCESTRSRSLRDVLLDPPQTGHDYRHLTRPQADILFDEQGRCVAHFLMRYESLQQDFDTVCDRLARSRINLPHVNVGAHQDYRSCFDDECRTLFEARFARDIAAFGYHY